ADRFANSTRTRRPAPRAKGEGTLTSSIGQANRLINSMPVPAADMPILTWIPDLLTSDRFMRGTSITGLWRKERPAASLRRQRRRARRRGSLPCPHILGAALLVFFRRQALQFGVAALDALLKNLFEKRNAPGAARAGAAAFGELARHLGLLRPHVVYKLPPAHVKAITDLGVQVHHPSPGSSYPNPLGTGNRKR